MTLDFNRLRRQFYKARDALEDLNDAGGYEATISAERGQPVESVLDLSDEEAATRLVVVMRPFLAPGSPLHIDTLLDELEREDVPVPEDELRLLREHRDAIEERQMTIKYNDREISPGEIYSTIAEGAFFEEDEEAVQRLKKLQKGPLQTIVWFQFLNYTEQAFGVVYGIKETLSSLAEDDLPYNIKGPPSLEEEEYQCIYCRTTDGGFENEEHYLPESLGNYFEVLPCGYVCRECNNGPLARLDDALASFGPIVLLRVQFVPYTKEGELPSGPVDGGVLRKTAPREIQVVSDDEDPIIEEVQTDQDEPRLEISVGDASGVSPRTMGRALCKVGLGLVAYREGHQAVLGDRYDPVRRFIVGEQDGFDNRFLMFLEAEPHPQVRFDVGGTPGRVIVINMFGLRFLVSLESTPVLSADSVYDQKGSLLVEPSLAEFPLNEEVSWEEGPVEE